MARLVIDFNDLSDSEVTSVLERASSIGASRQRTGLGDLTIGLLFLSPSLRTRVGFATASFRLGWNVVDAHELRIEDNMSASESFEDTIRTLSGMVDMIVTRVPFTLERPRLERACRVPLVSGGDAHAHPTQALIDLHALGMHGKKLADIHLGICGDLGMRTVRSLLDALSRFPPRRITLVAPPGRDNPAPIPERLQPLVDFSHDLDPRSFDVLYLAGLPERARNAETTNGSLDAQTRARFSLDLERVAQMRADAIVLSPLPLVDEVHIEAATDPRMRYFDQSDAGVPIRMALLELMAG